MQILVGLFISSHRDRAIDRLKAPEKFPNTLASFERFRLTVISKQQRAERADFEWRAERDRLEQREEARARMKLQVAFL
eukprot:SAG31_NODE_1296_length_8945_cov_6.341510_8_plen_79_part_00